MVRQKLGKLGHTIDVRALACTASGLDFAMPDAFRREAINDLVAGTRFVAM